MISEIKLDRMHVIQYRDNTIHVLVDLQKNNIFKINTPEIFTHFSWYISVLVGITEAKSIDMGGYFVC